MKKFAAILLALVLCVMLVCSAVAEQKMFVMTAVTDFEGNVLVYVTDEGTVLDADGNDVTEEFPVLVVCIDDAAMTCIFGTEEETIVGVIEVVAQVEDGVVLQVTFEDESVLCLVYTVTGTNAITLVDEENGLYYIMPEIAAE